MRLWKERNVVKVQLQFADARSGLPVGALGGGFAARRRQLALNLSPLCGRSHQQDNERTGGKKAGRTKKLDHAVPLLARALDGAAGRVIELHFERLQLALGGHALVRIERILPRTLLSPT